MKTTRIGPLRVRRVTRPTGENYEKIEPLTCVLMHGFGAPGDDLVALAGAIDVPPGTELVFPEAPHALAELARDPRYGDARAWWMIDVAGLERALATGTLRDLSTESPPGLPAARAAMSEVLDELAREAPGRRLVLGGFSQGAMLALDLALREPGRPLAGLVLLSGALIAAREWVPRMTGRAGTPVFQSHGRSDVVLSFAGAEQLRDALTKAGLDVRFQSFQGPHTIPPAVLEELGPWLHARR